MAATFALVTALEQSIARIGMICCAGVVFVARTSAELERNSGGLSVTSTRCHLIIQLSTILIPILMLTQALVLLDVMRINEGTQRNVLSLIFTAIRKL